MRAAMFYGKEDLRIEEIPEPSPGPGQVKLKNAFGGICGSDVHFYYNPDALGIDLTVPNQLTGAALPVPLGHEFSGTVVELGSGVTGIEVGDRVAVDPIIRCGSCRSCRKGLTVCPNFASYGLSADSGGMQVFSVVGAAHAHVLPENVSLEMGALVEPMCVAWHAIKRSRPAVGDTALILGAGPIGIGAWFALRAHGITNIIVSDPSQARRENIANLGCTQAINPIEQDLAEYVGENTREGIDIVIDAAGAGDALKVAIGLLAPAGRAILVAVHGAPVSLETVPMMLNEHEIRGPYGYLPADLDEVIDAMSAGAYNFEGWVSTMPLDDLVVAIERLHAGTDMKILLPAE